MTALSTERSVSVVVPVYNSEAALPELVRRLERVLARQGAPFELVLVNDGSRDRSWKNVQALALEHKWIHGINLMRNSGQHNALLCGIRAARHELIVTLDDDLQNPPEEIPKLLDALGEDDDLVYGAPREERHGLWRDLASQVTKLMMQKSVGAETARMTGPFRLFRAELRSGFENVRGPFVNIDVLLTWSTTRFKAIRVNHEARQDGRSN